MISACNGFRTSDDTFFMDKGEAEKYEAAYQFAEWCSENICRGGEWDSRMVADEILAHWKVTPL